MIEVTNLVRRYGKHTAVDHASFKINKGEIVGFLGPNGAGKSTTMNILTGYLSATEGTVKVDGQDILDYPTEIKRKIGYLPENPPLYMDMTVGEFLSFAAEIKGIPATERKDKMNRVMETVGVHDVSKRLIKNLSKGYKQRVGLAQAIVHDPPILILDEPTSGLDPNQIIEIRALIRELGKRKAVILSTHILQEVEAVCSRILILNEGRIAAQGTPEEIAGSREQGADGEDAWELHLKGADAAEAENRLIRLELQDGAVIAGVSAENVETGTVRLCFTIKGSGESGERIFKWAVSQGFTIVSMNRKKLSLEDLFVKHTSEERGGKPHTSEERSDTPLASKEQGGKR